MADAPVVSPLPGVKEMLMGPTGSGKTTAIRTLIDAGLEPFCIFTEPGSEVIGDLPDEKVHWHYIPPADVSWLDMIASATKINQLSFESLSKLTDINKRSYDQFIDLIGSCNNFKCDRCHKEFGDVAKWPTKRVLVMDSLTGISIMAMNLVVGSKPVKSMADWGVAMDNLERFITKLCTDLHCHFVLMAHSERETDEVLGGSKIMASTLGRKLAPKIPRFFSDVVLSVREGATFTWSTAALGADLKARNLPIRDGLPPSFVPVIENWKKQGGIIEG